MKKPTIIFSLILILCAAGALNAQTVAVDKNPLSFSAQVGGPVQSQQLTISSSTGSPFVILSNASWLKINGASGISGGTPATLTITADPTNMPAGTYNGNLAVSGSSGPTVDVRVTFNIGSIGVSPGSVNFAYQVNGVLPSPATITLSSTSNINYTIAASTTTGGNWLSVPASGTSPGTFAIAPNPAVVGSGMAVGTYNGKVTLTPSSGPAIEIPVVLTVTAAPTIGASATTVNLNYQPGGATGSTNSASTVVTLTNPGIQDLPFGIVTDPNGSWLSATPTTGSIPANGTAQVTISYLTATNQAQGAYSGRVTILVPNAANQQIQIAVNLRVSNSPLLTVPNGALAFTYQIGAALPAAKTFTATTSNAAADAASGQMTLALSKSDNSSWLTIPSSGLTGSANPISVSVNPAGLAVGNYNATISVIGNGAANNPQTVPVTLSISNDPLIIATFAGCSSVNTQCPLNFPIQIGQSSPTTQNVKVASSTGASAAFTATVAMASSTACGNAWLSSGVTTAATGPEATFPITVTPGTIVAGTTCNGTITISGTNPATGAALPNTVTIPVRMDVSANPMMVANPIAVNFTLAPNAASAQQTVTVTSTSSTNLDFNAVASSSAPWLLAFPLARNTATGSNVVTIVVNPSGLNPGSYSASVTLTAVTSGVQNSPLTIPVTVTVSAATMTVSPTSVSFQQALGSNPPAAKTVTVSTSNVDIAFTTSVATLQGSGWLSATPSGTATSATPATVSINVNGSNLPAGTYQGTVTITAPNASGSPATVNVTFEVLPGTLSASPAALTFDQVAGGAAPTAKAIAVSGTPGALNFTVAVSTEGNSGNWLSVDKTSGATNSNVQVSVNAATLAPGQYKGKVTITSTGASGSPIEVPVTLNVAAAQTFTVSPATLDFSYVIGTAAPQPKTAQLTSSAPGVPFTASATTTSGGNWLAVSPASAAGSGTLTVSINTAGLVAGNYTGTIAINSPNAASNPAATVRVNLTVTAIPKPVILDIKNAASWVRGGISPGELIVIGGTGIGPASIAGPLLVNNALPVTVGNTQVFFDNIAAPIYYASDGQTAVLAPYGISGRPTTSVRVVYSGVSSDPLTYNVIAAAPGIFTANSGGTGQIAIWEQQYAANGVPKDGVITFYVTGEGNNTTNGPDGAIASSTNPAAWYKPSLPVTVTVGDVPATVEYYGTAPGVVYGVMQMNVRIPAAAPSGVQPIVVSVGGNKSQPTATINVQ